MDLAAIRKRHNWSQAELAERLGVSPGHIGDLESKAKRRRLTVALAARLEQVTGETGFVSAVATEIADGVKRPRKAKREARV